MSIEAPKKERKFLKAIGKIGKVLAEELVLGIGRKFIGKVVDKVRIGKRQQLILLFAMFSIAAFAQYPSTGNKQRLGYQTTGDGLVWRGSLSDTASIQPTGINNAWVIIDTVNLKFYSFDFTSNVWNQMPSGTSIDTTSLSNRINLKVNIADTATMLLPYLRKIDTASLSSRINLKLNIADTAAMLANYASKAYADTSGRFYARQDFTNVSSSTLTWTQSDTLVTGGVSVVQVYRNGQILLPTQYTIPTNASVVIGATAYKAGENYTVIFPRGGGAGSGGGSGSLTSISGGTGITVSPNPITTTGTVSADLTVLMELSDTTTLSNRINLKLNAADTVSLSNRINAKGSGTVTSIATGYGLSGGTITTSGTLLLDSATVFNRIRDSIVDVAIGTDTIKILKQEYPGQTSSVLNWTVTSKFPIQLKAFILVFRNGQLLNNNQYDITDTAQITIVSSSFKSGGNYTVATVSGIGSVSSGQGNPVYPEAGIALSTGTTWTTSITNNSTNWNTAYTDRLKWDGGSTGLTAATGRTSLGGTTIGQNMFTLTNPSAIRFPRFNADNTIDALSAADFRSAIGTGTVTSVTAAGTSGNPISITNTTTTPTIDLPVATSSANGYLSSANWTIFNNKQNALTNPVTGTGASGHLLRFTSTSNIDSTGIYASGDRIGVGIDASTAATHLSTKFVVRDNGNNFRFNGASTTSGYTTTISHDNTGLKIGHSSDIRDIRFTLNGTSGLTIANNANSPVRAVGIGTDAPAYKLDVNGTLGVTGAATLSSTLAVTGAITEGGNNVMTNLDTVSLSNRINNKVGLTGNETVAGNKTLSGNTTMSGTVTMSSTSATPTSLLGKDGSNFVGSVTLGSGLSLSSGTLSINNKIKDINQSTYTIASDDFYIDNFNSSTTTITLPSAASNTYRELKFHNRSTGAINSSPDVISLTGSTTSSILSASSGKWATLVSDGFEWRILQAN